MSISRSDDLPRDLPQDRFANTGEEEKRGVYISPLFPLPIICFFLFGRETIVCASLLAAFVHECGHLAAIGLAGGRITRLELRPFGGEIRTGGRLLSYGQSLFVSFSGILVNLLSVPCICINIPFWRAFGLCSAGLALFNLLPARGLDGGEMLSDLLSMRLQPETADKVLRITTLLSACLLTLLFLYGLLCTCFNPLLPLLAVYLLFRALQRA